MDGVHVLLIGWTTVGTGCLVGGLIGRTLGSGMWQTVEVYMYMHVLAWEFGRERQRGVFTIHCYWHLWTSPFSGCALLVALCCFLGGWFCYEVLVTVAAVILVKASRLPRRLQLTHEGQVRWIWVDL